MKNELTDKEQRLREAAEIFYSTRSLNDYKGTNTYNYGIDRFIDAAKSEAAKQYHQSDNKAVDIDKLITDFINSDASGLICDVNEAKRIFDFFKSYIQSPPKALSDGESDAVEFADWIEKQGYIKSPQYGWYKNITQITDKTCLTTTELYKQFKTDTK